MQSLAFVTTLGMMISTMALAGDAIKLRDEKTGVEYGPVKLENGARISVGGTTLLITVIEQTETQKALERKLRNIIIPQVNFREAGLQDAVDFLRERARALDPGNGDVNIVVAIPIDDDAPEPRLTLNLHSVSLYDVLRYCCEAGGLQMRIDDHAVVLTP